MQRRRSRPANRAQPAARPRPTAATPGRPAVWPRGWRSAGLATLLILLLARAAAERGIHTFTASYLAGNRPVAALVQEVGGLGRQVIKQGIAEFSLALGQQPSAVDRENPSPGG
jgi:hypothetical protein